MRIGEVAIISPPGDENNIFIETICDKIDYTNGKLCFGRLDINDQLALHFYGINLDKDEQHISWDLISSKILGYVIIFDWNNHNSLEYINDTLDFFFSQFDAPLIVVANTNDVNSIPIPPHFYESSGISVAPATKFFFAEISNPENSKKIVATIIDILLEKF